MPYIKGMLGTKVIAEENINEASMRKQRRLDDPVSSIRIDCKIPQNIHYQLGSMDIFNFGDELQKIQMIKYAEVLKLENEFNEAFSSFKY
jgi:type III secretion system FlhB-like substrate exporter